MKVSVKLTSGSLIIALLFVFCELPINSYAVAQNKKVKPNLRGLQSSNNGIPKLMTQPCTLIRKADRWQCAIDPADSAEEGTILPIDGYYIPSYPIDNRGEPIVSGQSTMFSPRVIIEPTRIFVPPSATPIFENPMHNTMDIETVSNLLPYNPAQPHNNPTTLLDPYRNAWNGNNWNDPNSYGDSDFRNSEWYYPHACYDVTSYVDLVMSNGRIRQETCSNIGGGLCQRPTTVGTYAFQVCAGSCAEYPILRWHPAYPNCGRFLGPIPDGIGPFYDLEKPEENWMMNTLSPTFSPIDPPTDPAISDRNTPSIPMEEPCTIVGEEVDYANGEHDFFWRCEVEDGILLPIEGYNLSRDAVDDTGNPIISGESTMYAHHIRIEQDRIVVPPGIMPAFGGPSSGTPWSRVGGPSSERPKRRVKTEGDKPILVVRVIGADSSPTLSLDEISDKVFGNHRSLKSQFAQCSNDKMKIKSTEQGVVDVMISNVISGADRVVIANAAMKELKEAEGFTDLPGDYHHVMVCLPPGTNDDNWLAYSFVNHWYSVYSDENCGDVNIQMHGIGHNLALSNAEEFHDEDEEQSSVMGHALLSGDAITEMLCYNGPHSWQLGWYEDKQTTVNPLVSGGWNGSLNDVVDYSKTGETVLLQINANSTTDYYVAFNRNNDEVLISEMSNEKYSDSFLMASLGADCLYSFYDLDGSGELITIMVNSITVSETSVQPSANISIYTGTSLRTSAGKSCNVKTLGQLSYRNSEATEVAIMAHSCVTPGNTTAGFLTSSGEERSRQCWQVGKGLCQRGAPGGGKVYQVCSQQCAEYDDLRELPDFPACGKMNPSRGDHPTN